MIQRLNCSALILPIAMSLFAPVTAATEEDASGGSVTAAAGGPPILHVRLAPLEGYVDEASFVESISSRARELGMQARETVDLPTRTDLLLAAANLVLGQELEPACTGKLLRLSSEELPQSQDQIREAFDRADAMLVEADASLDDVRNLAEPPAEWIARASDRLATLGAFAHALQAYLLPEGEADMAESDLRAASRLAVLLEDSRPRVAVAATLWQASLKARATEPSRVMSALKLVLSRPPSDTLRYSFFARLLRCRVLASRGGHAAALALLTQLEDRWDAWLVKEEDRADAVRAITLAEIQILRDWHDQIPGPPDSPRRQWCVERMEALIKERFSGGDITVFRLTAAIPIIAAPEEAGLRERRVPKGD